MNLRSDREEVLDTDGHKFADMDALRTAAMLSARDIISEDAKRGVIDLRFRIDAENMDAQVVYTLSFVDAVSIITDDLCAIDSTNGCFEPGTLPQL